MWTSDARMLAIVSEREGEVPAEPQIGRKKTAQRELRPPEYAAMTASGKGYSSPYSLA